MANRNAVRSPQLHHCLKGYLVEKDVTILGRMATIDSPEIFILDSFCLASFSLSGAQMVSVLGLGVVPLCLAAFSLSGAQIVSVRARARVSVGVRYP